MHKAHLVTVNFANGLAGDDDSIDATDTATMLPLILITAPAAKPAVDLEGGGLGGDAQ